MDATRRAFHAVYLLTSRNPKFRKHTYIGFTVDPKRRLRQHNGEIQNGAKKTRFKRPWEMLLFVHGFPTKVEALQFEWAYQHPRSSRHFKAVARGLTKIGPVTFVQAKIRIVHEMLRVPPWCNFPLKMHVLTKDEELLTHIRKSQSAACAPLPSHVNLTHGTVDDLSTLYGDAASDNDSDMGSQLSDSSRNSEQSAVNADCFVCLEPVDEGRHVSCPNQECRTRAHAVCLAEIFLEEKPTQIIPKDSSCPVCDKFMTWPECVSAGKTVPLPKKKAAKRPASQKSDKAAKSRKVATARESKAKKTSKNDGGSSQGVDRHPVLDSTSDDEVFSTDWRTQPSSQP